MEKLIISLLSTMHPQSAQESINKLNQSTQSKTITNQKALLDLDDFKESHQHQIKHHYRST